MPAQVRQGGAAIWGLILLGVLLAALVIAVDLGVVWNTQAELRTVADAAALAAAHAWAEQLSPWITTALPAVARQAAYQAAARYVSEHSGDGTLHLSPNPKNAADGDLVFGFYDRGRGFVPARLEDLDGPWPNAVRIAVRRDHAHGNPAGLIFGPLFGWPIASVQAQAVAVLERRIVGFRCTDGQAVPLVPIALLSDPTGQTPHSWESQLAAQGAFLAETLTPHEDHVPSVTFRLSLPASTGSKNRTSSAGQTLPTGSGPGSSAGPIGESPQDQHASTSACVLRIGTGSRMEAVRQVLTGLLPHDLDDPEFAGQFVIEPTLGYRRVSAWSEGFALEDAALSQLITALAGLQQRREVRIWPLFASVTKSLQPAGDREHHGQGMNQAAITGFVAARILRVEIKSSSAGAYLAITLQPQLLVTRTAIATTDRPVAQDSDEVMMNPYLMQANPYLLRIQLVE